VAGIAADVVDGFEVGRGYILGPGTTTRAIAREAGIAKTLIGVDALLWTDAGGQLLLADARADQLEALVRRQPSSIVLTPIGGQGSLLGRGNQQLSPGVLRSVGREGLIVVAAPAKLDALAGRPLFVDTGDTELDLALAGHMQVVTGYHERTVMPVVAA
jgi:predicted polyphosphate/ATP-dependent NAD kinase